MPFDGHSSRDPYSGFRKVFVMPPPNGSKEGSKDYESLGQKNFSTDAALNRSAQLGEILTDKMNASKVVDNVMNFFRYKEPDRH